MFFVIGKGIIVKILKPNIYHLTEFKEINWSQTTKNSKSCQLEIVFLFTQKKTIVYFYPVKR